MWGDIKIRGEFSLHLKIGSPVEILPAEDYRVGEVVDLLILVESQDIG